jgi:hypothetical protein
MRVMFLRNDTDLTDYPYCLVRRRAWTSAIEGLAEGPGRHPGDLSLLYTDQRGGLAPGTQELCQNADTPIPMFSHRSEEGAHADLLEAGTDSVLAFAQDPKPGLTSMRALLRRTNSMPVSILPTADFGGIRLSHENRSGGIDGLSSSRQAQLELRLLYLPIPPWAGHPG